ncbi:ABC transporter permease [candidate division KSB1 bacterium]|nr:ABC transporter permease [candidate division KSB1 bacterium]
MQSNEFTVQFKENVLIALDVIRSNKMRSFLTLLGVIIGVMSIIGVQSLIEGFQKSISEQIEQLGANVFQVQKYPALGNDNDEKYRNRKDITWENAKAIEKYCTAVERVGPEAWHFEVVIKYRDKKTSPANVLAGGTPEFFVNNSYFIDEGRAFSDVDVQQKANVAVLGKDIVDTLFPYENPLGKVVTVDGRRYQVVGTLEEIGSRFGGSEDNKIAIPLSTFLKYYGSNRSLNITVQAASIEMMDIAQEQVIGVLRAVRKVPPGEPNDFEIWSSDTIISTFNNMTKAVRIGAMVIVSFSLLVAGIGIMNIMLVSIRERTREIGIRMAIGARRADIRLQFLIEAMFLSILGGFIGIITGVGLAQLISLVSPVPAAIPVSTIFLAFIVCAIVGIVFGVYPAAKASKLDPIESLRFE